MRCKSYLSAVILLISFNQAIAQGAKWEKDVPGKLIKAPPSNIPAFKADALFEIINRIPLIKQPKGFNVEEGFRISTKKKIYTGIAFIQFWRYISYDNGPIKLMSRMDVPPTIVFAINNPKELMNEQSILFEQERLELQLQIPVMFTDTFPITYKNINGAGVGTAITTLYDSRKRLYILNPKHTAFFKPITREQYIRFFIGKLGLDIKKDAKQVEENKANFAEIAGNPAMSNSLPELQKIQNGLIKWVNFLKSKKQYYEKKLVELSLKEKNAPAYYAMYSDLATIMDRNGKYVENISGHIPYESAEITDTLYRTPIHTFINNPFDEKLPKSAFQLIVIKDPYWEEAKNEIKDVLDKEFYPNLSFKDMAELMYK